MRASQHSPWIRNLFYLAVAFSALTGFAQMPIFKRYYIADIPGLGWLGQYYTTYSLHYISSILVVGLGAYLLTAYLMIGRESRRAGRAAYVRAVLLCMTVVTGGLLVIRNLPGYRFSPPVVVALDFAHLGLVMLFLLAAFATLVSRKRRPAGRF